MFLVAKILLLILPDRNTIKDKEKHEYFFAELACFPKLLLVVRSEQGLLARVGRV